MSRARALMRLFGVQVEKGRGVGLYPLSIILLLAGSWRFVGY